MTTFGIIGAGNIGTALARGLADRGHEVLISNSRGPETLADLVADIGGGARAATVQDAATAGEVIIVTVPLKALGDVPVEPLAGKIVLDTNNYYWERDGHIAALDQKQTTTTRLAQDHLPTSKVVKAFNHILSSQILTDGTPAGTPGRRALATASDHPEAIAFVTDLYDSFGYDTVDVGSVDESWRIERDQPGYGVPKNTAETLREAFARAER